MSWVDFFGRKVKAKDVTDSSGKTPVMTYSPFKLLYSGTWAKGATKTIADADKYKLFCLYILNHGTVLLACKEPQGITTSLCFSTCRDNTVSTVYKVTFDKVNTNNWVLLGASNHILNTNGNAGTALYDQTMYIYGIL